MIRGPKTEMAAFTRFLGFLFPNLLASIEPKVGAAVEAFILNFFFKKVSKDWRGFSLKIQSRKKPFVSANSF